MILGACLSSRLASCPRRQPARDLRPVHVGACQRAASRTVSQQNVTIRGPRGCCAQWQNAAELPASRSLRKPAKLAIFVSGGGSNFRAIHDAILMGRIRAQISAVVSDAPGCGAWAYARQAGIPTFCFPHSSKPYLDMPADTPSPLDTTTLVQVLKHQLGVDYVVLAGYLKLVPAELVREYKDAMLNIHPGLLPAFGGKGLYGLRVHKAVIASGARFSGATVHFVDEQYDTGPILAQAMVPVDPYDTPKSLAARVLEQEHKLYPSAVAALADGRITWREDGVPILWSPH